MIAPVRSALKNVAPPTGGVLTNLNLGPGGKRTPIGSTPDFNPYGGNVNSPYTNQTSSAMPFEGTPRGPADPSLIGLVSNGMPMPSMGRPVQTGGTVGSPPAPTQQPTTAVNTAVGDNSAQQGISQQQFGLSGAEQALMAGFGGAAQSLNAGAMNAVQTLGGDFSVMPAQMARSFNANASAVDPLTGQPMFSEAARGVGEFAGAGLQAQNRQAALSGALGPEAQAQAISQFNESPGQQFLREQGQESIINQAAALGGLGGGNVQKELARFGTGLAQQDFANQVDRLAQLSGQGLQAAGQQGQFLSQAGQQQGNLAAQNAQFGTQVSLANASNALSSAQANAQLRQQAGMSNAANALTAAQAQAGIQNQQGINVGNLFQGTAQNVAQNRFQAGRDIASQIGQGTSALSSLANQQGTGLSNLIGSGASNIANLLSGAGQFSAQQQQQLAQLLANTATGQGTQLANIAQNQGVTDANLAIQGGDDSQAFIGNLLTSIGSIK